jgi:hypothetical protein
MGGLSQYWWIIPTWIYYTVFAWASTQNNVHGGKWIWINFLIGALCPFWILVARYSKNIIFDGMLYDHVLFLSFIVTTWYLGFADGFNSKNWLGLSLVIVGFIMMRLK